MHGTRMTYFRRVAGVLVWGNRLKRRKVMIMSFLIFFKTFCCNLELLRFSFLIFQICKENLLRAAARLTQLNWIVKHMQKHACLERKVLHFFVWLRIKLGFFLNPTCSYKHEMVRPSSKVLAGRKTNPLKLIIP